MNQRTATTLPLLVVVATFCLGLLCGCGNRGDLYLPDSEPAPGQQDNGAEDDTSNSTGEDDSEPQNRQL